MSTTPTFDEWLETTIAAWTGRRGLRACTRVGRGARLYGRPCVVNRGHLEIGDDFAMSSSPVAAHLATTSTGRIEIGSHVRIGHGTSVFAHELVAIGEGTRIGPLVMILDVDFHEVRDRASMGTPRPIRIGRHVRIGSGVIVLRGATVGDGACIAPNSVVSRAVPAGAHVAGVPARPIPNAFGRAA